MTIWWSSAAGNVDGYRVWAYVADPTQEDETFDDPTTLSFTFNGKDSRIYDIDIYSHVTIDGVQYWSPPIEGELEIGKIDTFLLSICYSDKSIVITRHAY